MEKALIIGANGFLGRKILSKYEKTFETIGSDVVIKGIDLKYNPIIMDITNYNNVDEIYKSIKPNLTVLTAAMTDVDGCEDAPDKANKINAIGPQNVAKAIKKYGGRLIHISTDFIFDGIQGNYTEKDAPNPLSVYGKSKLDGEKLILEQKIPTNICRTSVLFGWPFPDQRDNFFSWAHKQLQQKKPLKIVKNQINTPTLVDDLAEFIFRIANFKKSEIYHTTCPETISRYDFIKKLIEVFEFDMNLLTEAPNIVQKAKRPQNSSLNTTKLQKSKIYQFKDIYQCFKFLKENLLITKQ